MVDMPETSVWQRFDHDPRQEAYAALRASHADRELVLQELSAAYADGRLDPTEFEERSDAVAAARTLGDLPPLLADLVPETTPAGATAPGTAVQTTDQLRQRAVAKWEKDRRDALWGFLVPTLVCWVIWGAVMLGDFPWPLFVMLGTGINLAATQFKRTEIIEREVRRLEKRQARAIERQQRRELEGPSDDVPAQPES